VEAQIQPNEQGKFDDLIVAVVFSQCVEERSIDRVGICTHKLAVEQGDLFRFGIALAVSIVLNAFVEQFFG
jgi:hypothetical protein